MSIKSYWRGHPIIYVKRNNNEIILDNDGNPDPATDGQWLYVDTMEPTPGYGGGYRPCGKCKKSFAGSYNGDADPCLGELPGVDNACCGHGFKGESYIRFTNGIIIKNFDIEYPISIKGENK